MKIRTFQGIAAYLLIVTGVYMLSAPAALIVAGVLLIADLLT